jgi:hypothetical protein
MFGRRTRPHASSTQFSGANLTARRPRRPRRPRVLAPATGSVAFGTIHAAAAPRAIVRLLIDGRPRGRDRADRRGRASFRVPVEGRHRIVVRSGGRASRPVDAWLLARRQAVTGPPFSHVRVSHRLERRLRRVLAGSAQPAGAMIVNLATGRGAAVNAGARFPAASSLKVAIAIVAAARGFDAPGSARWAVMRQMLVVSDNLAADRILGWIGGPYTVDRLLHRLGLARSFFVAGYVNPTGTLASLHVGVEREPALHTAKATTPYELGLLLRMVHARAIGAGGGPLRRVLRGRRGRIHARRILALLLDNADTYRAVVGWPTVPHAHKSGYNEQVQADAGIWYGPRGPILISAMVAGTNPAVLQRVGLLARRAYGGRG